LLGKEEMKKVFPLLSPRENEKNIFRICNIYFSVNVFHRLWKGNGQLWIKPD